MLDTVYPKETLYQTKEKESIGPQYDASMLDTAYPKETLYQTKEKESIGPQYDASIEAVRGFIYGGIICVFIWLGIFELIKFLL